jgi:hypothetical protein
VTYIGRSGQQGVLGRVDRAERPPIAQKAHGKLNTIPSTRLAFRCCRGQMGHFLLDGVNGSEGRLVGLPGQVTFTLRLFAVQGLENI